MDQLARQFVQVPAAAPQAMPPMVLIAAVTVKLVAQLLTVPLFEKQIGAQQAPVLMVAFTFKLFTVPVDPI